MVLLRFMSSNMDGQQSLHLLGILVPRVYQCSRRRNEGITACPNFFPSRYLMQWINRSLGAVTSANQTEDADLRLSSGRQPTEL
jgi:hypothetical protein